MLASTVVLKVRAVPSHTNKAGNEGPEVPHEVPPGPSGPNSVQAPIPPPAFPPEGRTSKTMALMPCQMFHP
jgi:hypothetical protein